MNKAKPMCGKNKTKSSIETEDFPEVPCPAQLQEYINLANLIPAGFVFPMRLSVYRHTSENYPKSDHSDLPTNESITEAYKHFAKDLPESLLIWWKSKKDILLSVVWILELFHWHTPSWLHMMTMNRPLMSRCLLLLRMFPVMFHFRNVL